MHPITRLKARLGLKPSDAGTYQAYLKSKLTPEVAEKVTFTGFVPRLDLVDRFYDADIFVFPPIWEEGFGLPPVEAMAAGTPVVGARSGALPETVIDGDSCVFASVPGKEISEEESGNADVSEFVVRGVGIGRQVAIANPEITKVTNPKAQ